MTNQDKQWLANELNKAFSDTLEYLDFKLKKFGERVSQLPVTEEPKQEKEKQNEK